MNWLTAFNLILAFNLLFLTFRLRRSVKLYTSLVSDLRQTLIYLQETVVDVPRGPRIAPRMGNHLL